jgi:hypothetical protein
MTEAEKILTEFVNDCEAVGGGPHLGYYWPDLLITYNKAKRLLSPKDGSKGQRPVIYEMEPIGVDGADEATGVRFYCSDACRITASVKRREESDEPIQFGYSADLITGQVCDECGGAF